MQTFKTLKYVLTITSLTPKFKSFVVFDATWRVLERNSRTNYVVMNMFIRCNEKYDNQGESSIAQDRKTMLPNLFTKETFCAGSNVRFLTIISRSAKS